MLFRSATELDRLLRDQLVAHVLERIGSAALEQAIEQIATRQLDAHTAADRLLTKANLF